MAGVRALEELLKVAPDMYAISIFGAEPHGNYNRILLSPVLSGEKSIHDIMLNDESWYADNSITLHKGRAKEIMAYYGVPTAPFIVANTRADARNVNLPFPLFAKPALEGSGKGITEKSLCTSRAKLVQEVGELLDTYQEPVLIESWLPGQEFTVAILGNGKEARCLPLVGMRWEALPLGAKPIYGYEAKWLWDTIDDPLDIYECPARLDPALADEMAAVCERAYRILRCRDWSRIDVRLDAAGRPNIIEVNPLPGILPNPADNSCLPKAARAAGIPYNELIRSALGFAAIRHGLADRPVPVSTVI